MPAGQGAGTGFGGGTGGGVLISGVAGGLSGQIRGRVKDTNGQVLPGVTIDVTAGGARRTVTSNDDGTFVLSSVPSGPVTLSAQLNGFTGQRQSFVFDQETRHADVTMPVGQVTENIAVTGEAAKSYAQKSIDSLKVLEPSVNVVNLQRRASGVLPVRIDVPRAGTSHQFVKPLVVDQEAAVTFRYKRR